LTGKTATLFLFVDKKKDQEITGFLEEMDPLPFRPMGRWL
jgi:hypothetical protein